MSTEDDKTVPDPATDRGTASGKAKWDKQDAEVAGITRTVQPKSDAPSRSGVTGSGSGADSERS
ncbi:MAG: hypothetical protein BGO51_19380 [Rhodospirillales bacterium 69-11]|nr:hypothetical protein [Rhodospirillales bacterium]OJW28640.1 MAG: hypothetical protein BGO51_19380 [Rhodospirillales bacterium 69-11]